MSVGKESKCVEAKGRLWDGLEHSCFVCWQSISLLKSVGKTKIPSIYHHRFGSDSLVPNGGGMKRWGFRSYFTIKVQRTLMRETAFK
jgi:hypothetical protein